jgi:uncharacterized Zn-binding protein involved in type VI secretion
MKYTQWTFAKINALPTIGHTQRKAMSKKHFTAPRTATSKWYTSSSLAIFLFFASVLAWFAIVVTASIDSDPKQTHLVLKIEGCDFLKMNGVATKEAGTGNGCAITVPFRQNMFGGGGLIILGDKKFRIAGDQIVFIGSFEDLSWTPEQIHTAIWVAVSTLIMLGMMVWIFILISMS